jgi:hypothetical protein
MRKTLSILAIAALGMVLMAVPAVADAPTKFTDGFMLYGEPDACNPSETMDIAFTFDVSAHDHTNNVVLIVDSSATSSTGYIGTGREIIVENKNWFMDRFNWQNVNPDTGDRISVKGNIKVDLDTGDVVLEDMEFKCLGGGN